MERERIELVIDAVVQTQGVDRLTVVKDKIDEINAATEEMQKGFESPIPAFQRASGERVGLIRQSATGLESLLQDYISATNARDRNNAAQAFNNAYSGLSDRVSDLRLARQAAQDLMSSITSDFSQEFAQAMKSFAPQFRNLIKETQSSLVDIMGVSGKKTATGSTESTEQIISNIIGAGGMNNAQYRNLVSAMRARSSMPTQFTDDIMEKTIRAMVYQYAPEFQRGVNGSYSGRDPFDSRTVESLMPQQFARFIQTHHKRSDFDTMSAGRKDRGSNLTQSQLAQLFTIIDSNPYIRDEAVQSGLLQFGHGKYMRRQNITQDDVNRFAGRIGRTFLYGAAGMPYYGIEDVLDPAKKNQIIRKSNQALTHSTKVAHDLAEVFGDWLDPYLTNDVLPKEAGSPIIQHFAMPTRKPRQTSMQFSNFVMGKNGELVEQKQPLFLNNSWYYEQLQKIKGATPFEHNKLNRDEFFVEIPEELYDSSTTPERRAEIRQQLVSLIGNKQNQFGQNYSYTGQTQTHLVFTRDDLRQAKEQEPGGKRFFHNGMSQTQFSGDTAAVDFGKAMQMQRTYRTEGEDIQKLFGTDTSDIRVVVADMKKLTGLDGQNFISNKYAKEGFQGRTQGVKGTYSVFDMKGLRKMYSNLINENGDLVIPGAGVHGGDLVIPADVGLIEDVSTLKANPDYAGLSQAEINARRTAEVRRDRIYGKTRYADAETDSRWIPAQVAQNFVMDQESQKYFRGILMHELAALEDPDQVTRMLFSDDSAFQKAVRSNKALLNSERAQETISQYRDQILARANKGDLLVPQGEMSYAMLAAWLPDVVNRAVAVQQAKKTHRDKIREYARQQGLNPDETDEQKMFDLAMKNGILTEDQIYAESTLTPEQRNASLRDMKTKEGQLAHSVFFMQKMSERVGMHRNPAVAAGNIDADNKAMVDEFIGIASQLGLDTNALYVDPASALMQKLQGADVDGDTALIYAMRHDKKFGETMQRMITNTIAQYQEIMKQRGIQQEEFDRQVASRTESLAQEGKTYDTESPEDIADFILNKSSEPGRMAFAQTISVNGHQLRTTPLVARAYGFAERNYDINQNGPSKRAEAYNASAEEKELAREGSPFMMLFNWASKAVTSANGEESTSYQPDRDENGRIIISDDLASSSGVVFDRQAFRKRKLDQVNFTSINSDQARNALYAAFIGRHQFGADVSGGFDWDQILEADNGFYNIGTGEDAKAIRADSATGRFIQRMRQVKAAQARGDFLFFDDSLVDELSAYGSQAYKEIQDSIRNDPNIKPAERKRKIEWLYNAVGGGALQHLREYGLTRSNMMATESGQEELESMRSLFGDDILFGRGNREVVEPYVRARTEAIQRRAAIQKEIDDINKQLGPTGNTNEPNGPSGPSGPTNNGNANNGGNAIPPMGIQPPGGGGGSGGGVVIEAPHVTVNTNTTTVNTGTVGSGQQTQTNENVQAMQQQIAAQQQDSLQALAANYFNTLQGVDVYKNVFGLPENDEDLVKDITQGKHLREQLLQQQGGQEIVDAVNRAFRLDHSLIAQDLSQEQRQAIIDERDQILRQVGLENYEGRIMTSQQASLLKRREELQQQLETENAMIQPGSQSPRRDQGLEFIAFDRLREDIAQSISEMYMEGAVASAKLDDRTFGERLRIKSTLTQERLQQRLNQLVQSHAITDEEKTDLEDQLSRGYPKALLLATSNKGARHAQQVTEKWDKIFSPKSAYEETIAPYEEDLRQMEGWLSEAVRQRNEAEKNGILGYLPHEEVGKIDTRIAQMRAQRDVAQKRIEKLREWKNEMDYFDQQQTEVDMAKIIQQTTGREETKEQYIQRMMLQKRQSLFNLRNGFGIDTEEYQKADALYRRFLENKTQEEDQFAQDYAQNRVYAREKQRSRDASILQRAGIVLQNTDRQISINTAMQEFRDRKRELRNKQGALTEEEAAILSTTDREYRQQITQRFDRDRALRFEAEMQSEMLGIDQASYSQMNARLQTALGGRRGRMALTGVGRTFGMARQQVMQSFMQMNNAQVQQDRITASIGQMDKRIEEEAKKGDAADQNKLAKMYAARYRLQRQQEDAVRMQQESQRSAFGVGGRIFGFDEKYNAAQERLSTARTAFEDASKAGKQDEMDKAAADMRSAENEMNQLATAGGAVNAALNTVGQTFLRIGSYFGRRLFQNAIREATQFVKVYDQTMHQIQAITMKSDNEMVEVRSKTIDQAITWKTSASNVAQVKSDLYRQGLSDTEVDRRAEAIVKFSTVTGAKVTQATKALTTAIQNGLVDTVEEAMDALTALGDSAATTAEEIFKGMQKSAAAAKLAGVSYEELTSMLTVITSKTQLGGAQAGTALQTIFSRMRRVTNQGYAQEESGETTSINDVEESLNRVGVSLREDDETFRSTTDVLRDLAKVWNQLNDIQKNNIMYNMAGARQANMFASLMEGLADEDGKTFDEYLGLAADSQGTTQSKYEIVIESINAELQELKQTFDGLVESFGQNGAITFIINGLTGITQVFSDSASAGQGFITVLGTLLAVLGAVVATTIGLAAAKSALFSTDPITAVAKATATVAALVGVVGAAAVGVSALVGRNAKKAEAVKAQESQQAADAVEYVRTNNLSKINRAEEAIAKAKEFEELSIMPADSDAAKEAYKEIQLATMAISDSVGDIQTETESWADAIARAQLKLDQYKKETAELALILGGKSAREKEQQYLENVSSVQLGISSKYLDDEGKYAGVSGKGFWSDFVVHSVGAVLGGNAGREVIMYDDGSGMIGIGAGEGDFDLDKAINGELSVETYQKMAQYLTNNEISYTEGDFKDIGFKWAAQNFGGMVGNGLRWLDVNNEGVDGNWFKKEALDQLARSDTKSRIAPQQYAIYENLFNAFRETGLFNDFATNYRFHSADTSFAGFLNWYSQIQDDTTRLWVATGFENYIQQQMPSIKQQISKSEKDVLSLQRSFVEDLFANEYAATVDYITGGDETVRAALVDKYLSDAKEQNKEVNTDNIESWLRSLTNDENFNAAAYARKTKSAEDYAYYLSGRSSANAGRQQTALLGLSGYSSQDIVQAIAEQQSAGIDPFTDEQGNAVTWTLSDGTKISSWENLNDYINEKYKEGTNSIVYNSVTGQAVNRTAAEVNSDYKLSDKDLGYINQKSAIYRAATKPGQTIEGLWRDLGVLENYEPFVNDSKEFQKLTQGLGTGATSMQDIIDYAFKEVYGEDRSAFNESMYSAGQQTETMRYLALRLAQGIANEDEIGQIASILKTDKASVKNNRTASAYNLIERANVQQNGMMQRYNQIAANMFGFSQTKQLEEFLNQTYGTDQNNMLDITAQQARDLMSQYGAYGLRLQQVITNDGMTRYAIGIRDNSEFAKWATQEATLNPYLTFKNGQFEFNYDAVSDITGFNSKTYAERKSIMSEYLNSTGQHAETNAMLNWMDQWTDQDWDTYGSSMAQTLGGIYGWGEEEIKRYSQKRYYNDMKSDIEKNIQTFQTDLRSMITQIIPDGKSLYSYENFDALVADIGENGSEAAKELVPLLNVLSGMIQLVGGKLIIGSSGSTENDFDNAVNGQSYAKNKAAVIKQRDVINAANSFVAYAAAQAVEEGIEPDLGYDAFKKYLLASNTFKSKQELEDYFENEDYAGDAFQAYKSGDLNLESFIDVLEQNSALGFLSPSLMRTLNENIMNEVLSSPDMLETSLENFAGSDPTGFLEYFQSFEYGKQALVELERNGEVSAETLQKLNAEIGSSNIRNMHLYGDASEEVASSLMELGAGGARASKETTKLMSQMSKLNNMKTAANKARGKAGKDLDKDTLGYLASYTDFNENEIKNMTADMVDQLADTVDKTAEQEFHDTIGNTIMQRAADSINEAIANNEITIDQALKFDLNASGDLDLDELEKLAQQLEDEELMTLVKYVRTVGTLEGVFEQNGDKITVKNVLTQLAGNGYKGKSGGGGGGGKSAAQKLLEELKRKDSEADHRLKMLQYEETRYENAGELTNVNALIGQENDLRAELNEEYEKNINKLKEQMAITEKNSDDWYSLRDAVLQYEEKIKESNNAIEENNRKIEENEQKIRKLRIALEQQVDQEIKNRIQRERDMLAGTVDMQNTILDSIKSRYEEEWKLVQKDIDKKKSALEEEKNLIDERLNKRKEAEDEAQKYEELAELRRQYALISMDSTRTKDATEIRKKITDMEKELAYASAEDEAKARQESLDEQINAYDKYVSNGEEDLQVLLDNANNFADEMNKVIGMKDTELYDWLKQNVTEYAKSVNEAQKQILLGWEDTYNQMMGITPTYWDSWTDLEGNEHAGVYEILQSRDSYLEFLKGSQDYINASDTDQAAMEYEWGKAYDDWINSLKTGAFWEHFDEWMDGLGSTSNSSSGGSGNKKNPLEEVQERIKELMKNGLSYSDKVIGIGNGAVEYIPDGKTKRLLDIIDDMNTNIPKNAAGGLVDYTGLAWVDGSLTKPEAFLSAADTELMRNMLDAASYLAFRPTISNIDGNAFGKGGISMGDVNITITEASFKEDADYEKVAERIGDAFVKQLNRQGLNMANYSFG